MGAGSIGSLTPILPLSAIRDAAVPLAQLIGEVALAADDSVSSLLHQIAVPQISDLLLQIERQRATLDPAAVSMLLHEAVAAVHEHDAPRALGKLSELIALAPERADTLAAEPALAPIRGQVVNLVQRINAETKVHADQVVAAAAHVLESRAPDSHHTEEFHLRGVLALASRLADTGRPVNLVRATELATAVISYFGPFVAAPSATRILKSRTNARGLGVSSFRLVERGIGLVRGGKTMWRRAPLVLLFLVWTAAGLLAWIASMAMGFGAWGVGLVALVGFGYYRSIRRLRF